MTALEIRQGLAVLREYYTAPDGTPHRLNDLQIAVYLDGLRPFGAAAFEAATRRWMRSSRWFPALSDLLALLSPEADVAAQTALAWAAVEAAIRHVGAYRSVQFGDAVIGEAVRQVFGAWPQACAFEFDSPGWTERRRLFERVFPTLARRAVSSPVLGGLHRTAQPIVIPHVDVLPAPDRQLTAGDDRALSHGESVRLLGLVRDRVLRDAREAS